MKPALSIIKRLFNSSSSYFQQPKEILAEERALVNMYLVVKGYEHNQRMVYLRAFDYFCMFPNEYDGATMTEDLCDIPGLDLDAMLHDWLYIAYQVSGNYYYIWMADKLMRTEMRKKGKSTINAGLRFVLLLVKTILFYPAHSFLFKGRRMTRDLKIEVATIYRALANHNPRPWHKEYAGELRWTAFIIFAITYFIYTI